MALKKISSEGNKIKLEVEIDLEGSMLEMEKHILTVCNEIGQVATVKAAERFDTDGSPIVVAGITLTTKGKTPKTYQTPFGPNEILRHTYQTSKGGKVYCPLEEGSRMIHSATPRYAQMLTNKYACMSASDTVSDLNDNHGRKTTKCYLQKVADVVGSIAQAKEETWQYHVPQMEEEVATVSISMDGTTVLMQEEGYREAMAGAISLYNEDGERMYSIYFGAAPEYGKATFKERMKREIAHIKSLYPKACYVGVADGAKDNWTFLEKHTDTQILDFYHATEYLAGASEAAFPGKREKEKRKKWLKDKCSKLKHDENAAKDILNEMTEILCEKKFTKSIQEKLESAITYFSNNLPKMDYSKHINQNLPIGSGVTEAACKTLIKQRFCCSGMRWKDDGVRVVLSLRSLVRTKGRWEQFWGKIDQYGVNY